MLLRVLACPAGCCNYCVFSHMSERLPIFFSLSLSLFVSLPLSLLDLNASNSLCNLSFLIWIPLFLSLSLFLFMSLSFNAYRLECCYVFLSTLLFILLKSQFFLSMCICFTDYVKCVLRSWPLVYLFLTEEQITLSLSLFIDFCVFLSLSLLWLQLQGPIKMKQALVKLWTVKTFINRS